jgi:predicted hydrocarbon binding protein
VDELAKAFADMLERLSFEALPKELSKVLGERAAAALIFNVIRDSAMSMAEDLKGMLKGETLREALLACYKPFELVGEPFDYEVVSEKPLTVRIKVCPHFKYVKERPFACIACAAVKAGAIEDLTGKKVQFVAGEAKYGRRDADVIIKRTKHMPSGDPYCEFVLEEA